ncbi:CDGSH iron-sulfur domain-containing protein [Streptomyces sp. NPDC054784]
MPRNTERENAGRDAATGPRPERPRRLALEPNGPLLVEGPVEVALDDGTVVASDRFTVAVCLCRRSRTYPWCDTSHRGRTRRKDRRDRTEESEPGDRTPPRAAP